MPDGKRFYIFTHFDANLNVKNSWARRSPSDENYKPSGISEY